MLILGPKMPHLPHFRYNKNFLKLWAMPISSVYKTLTSCKKSEKSNEQILRKVRKCQFWAQKCPISAILGIIRVFLKKLAPSLSSVYWTLTSCKKSEKSNEPILRKRHYRRTDGRTYGRTYGQTWIHRTRRLQPVVQKEGRVEQKWSFLNRVKP